MRREKTDGEPLMEALRRYREGPMLPMHMPGHKRNERMLGQALPWGLDVTEVGAFDDLHQPEGLLKDAMDYAAGVYGVLHSLFLVNGSSCGLLAAIRACTRRGDKVLVAQNSHRAVYHALELCGLNPVYLQSPIDGAFGVPGGIAALDVRAALEKEPDIRLCVITSPTYEGVISDVRAIADALHVRGVPLLVDEAHGAHLGFSGAFPRGAIACGADAVVQSLHKTLPSLTQTALLHVASERVDARELMRQLAVFETSSPSYVLMASIDNCVRRMEAEGEALLRAHRARLDRFSGRMRALRHLRVLCHGLDGPDSHPDFFAFDPSKLLISTRGAGLTGEALAEMLSDQYRIQLEMSMGDWALAMTSICDDDAAFTRLGDALLSIDAGLDGAPDGEGPVELPLLRQAIGIERALELPGEDVTLSECAGRVSREYVWAYPPGVPLLTPGAVVSPEFVRFAQGNVRLRSTRGGLPRFLCVLAGSVKFQT